MAPQAAPPTAVWLARTSQYTAWRRQVVQEAAVGDREPGAAHEREQRGAAAHHRADGVGVQQMPDDEPEGSEGDQRDEHEARGDQEVERDREAVCEASRAAGVGVRSR